MPDVQADADALVAVPDALHRRLGRRIEIGVVRTVVVHRGTEVILLHALVERVHHPVALEPPFAAGDDLRALLVVRDAGDLRVPLERHDRNVLHAVALGELAARLELLLRRIVERSRRDDLDAVLGALRLVRGDLRVRGVVRKGLLHEAHVVAVDVLLDLEGPFERNGVHRVTRDAQLERHLRLAAARAHRPSRTLTALTSRAPNNRHHNRNQRDQHLHR